MIYSKEELSPWVEKVEEGKSKQKFSETILTTIMEEQLQPMHYSSRRRLVANCQKMKEA
jgi:hypothetical protein